MTGLPSALDESLDRIPRASAEFDLSGPLEDSFDLEDAIDEEEFELPLKTRSRLFHESNFPDLDAMPSPEKRVRFEGSTVGSWSPLTVEKSEDLGKELMGLKLAQQNQGLAASSRKPHIEDLIQHAHSLNQYLDQNMDRINTFQSNVYYQGSEGPRSISQNFASNVATAPTTPSGSVSNFQLSEAGASNSLDNEQSACDDDLLTGALTVDNEREDHRIKQILSRHQNSTYPLSENQSTMSLSGDASNIEDKVLKAPKDLPIPSRDFLKTSADSSPHSSMSPNLKIVIPKIEAQRSPTAEESASDDEEKPPDIDCETALTIYTTTVAFLLVLSKNANVPLGNPPPQLATFNMDSTPTLAYEEYLQRLHCKFSFAPIVYLTAAHLLQSLFLTRKDNKLCCKYHLDNCQVHRLIIASIRLATKLLEDCVHSHTCFSRICGISKKLLTKLEIAFLNCINFEGLKITNHSLLQAAQVQQELSVLVS